MKRAAILLYDQFCNFEISVLLQIFAIAGKPVTTFAKPLAPVRCEEGLTVLPERALDAVDSAEFDCLILPGASDIREAIEDRDVIAFIQKFDVPGMTIGAISIAPLLLLRAGMLNGKPFMAGVNAEELYEEGFTPEELAHMVGWDECIKNPVKEGYIKSGAVITSISCQFVRWAIAVADTLGIGMDPACFGI